MSAINLLKEAGFRESSTNVFEKNGIVVKVKSETSIVASKEGVDIFWGEAEYFEPLQDKEQIDITKKEVVKIPREPKVISGKK